jgi:hypothetical protein
MLPEGSEKESLAESAIGGHDQFRASPQAATRAAH